MNLPNLLTMSRLVLIAGLMIVLNLGFAYAHTIALTLFVIAGVTDFLDGYLARTRNQVTAFGRLMDPLTDKVMVCAAFVSFVEIQVQVEGKGLSPLMPAWIVVIIIAREFLVTGLRLLAAGKGNIVSAGKWGKHKTVWQIVAIIAILLGLAVRHDVLGAAAPADLLRNFDTAFYWISFSMGVAVALVTVASGALYFMQHRDLIASGRS